MESGRDGEVGGEGQPNLFYIQSCTSSVSSTVGCNHKIDYAVIFLHFQLGPSCWPQVCRECKCCRVSTRTSQANIHTFNGSLLEGLS